MFSSATTPFYTLHLEPPYLPREVWRDRSPSNYNPQRQHVRCGVLSARKMCRWHIFSEERAGRPWARIFAKRSLPRESKNSFLAPLPPGVRSARKTGQWPVFSENGPAGPGEGARGKGEGDPDGGTCPPIEAFSSTQSVRSAPHSNCPARGWGRSGWGYGASVPGRAFGRSPPGPRSGSG